MLKLSCAAVVVVALAGCGKAADDSFAEAAPADLSALSLEISGADSEGAALVATDGVQRQGLDGTADGLVLARDRVKALNQAVRAVVTPIAELAAATSTQLKTGDTRVFGPQVKNGVSYKLTIARLGVERFGWKLEAKAAAAAETDYQLVAAGGLVKGALPHRGRGSIGIDFDTLRALDSTVKPAGKLLCGFAHVGDTKTLAYALKGFTADPATESPITAVFVGHRLMPSRATAVRVSGKFNLPNSPTAAQELVRARVRYVPGLGGRAELLATDGDVPAGKVYLGVACWDAQEVEGFAILRSCDKGVLPSAASCQVIATRGQLSNCKLAEGPTPSEDLNDASLEADAPAADVVTPTSMPSGEP